MHPKNLSRPTCRGGGLSHQVYPTPYPQGLQRLVIWTFSPTVGHGVEPAPSPLSPHLIGPSSETDDEIVAVNFAKTRDAASRREVVNPEIVVEMGTPGNVEIGRLDSLETAPEAHRLPL